MIGGGSMNDQRRSMKTYAFMGFVGGIIFVIGDCLLYCYKDYMRKLAERYFA